jgi:hypothetical protein
MNTEERAQALLDLVADERDKACRQLMAEAAARAAAIKGDAYRRERALLHQRMVAERSRAEALLRAAAAEQSTAERRRGEQAHAALLAAAWPRLEAALLARWSEAETRRQWVDSALDQSWRRLPRTAWTIRHAGGWPEAERAAALAALRRDGLPEPAMRADKDLAAGLVVSAGGAVLDMSLAGLLQDRARIEARLLALAVRAGKREQGAARATESTERPEEAPA